MSVWLPICLFAWQIVIPAHRIRTAFAWMCVCVRGYSQGFLIVIGVVVQARLAWICDLFFGKSKNRPIEFQVEIIQYWTTYLINLSRKVKILSFSIFHPAQSGNKAAWRLAHWRCDLRIQGTGMCVPDLMCTWSTPTSSRLHHMCACVCNTW